MRHYLIAVIFINFTSISLANAKDETPAEMVNQINKLETNDKKQSLELAQLKTQNTGFSKQLTELQTNSQKEITSLKSQLAELSTQQQQIQVNNEKNSESIHQLGATTQSTTSQLANQLTSRTIGFIIGLITLLGLMALSLFALRKRYLQANKTLSQQVETALLNVKTSEESIVKADTQLADKLLEVVSELKKQPAIMVEQVLIPVQAGANDSEIDHSLALKLADEIHRMRKRIEALPQETKGLKSLSKSLERLEDELNEQGYEIIDNTGQPYDENMSVNAQLIPSDDLQSGESIISKVISPQINYQGKLIRMANIEVNVG